MVAIPLFVIVPFAGIVDLAQSPTVTNLNNIVMESTVITKQEDDINKKRAEIIDSYFESKNAPLAGYGKKFVEEANEHDIDWRLLPAIAMRESTGGRHSCKKVSNSVFGYGSCKFGFKSIDESIEIVARSIGGNNPKTARYYKDKNTEAILKTYNPDSIIPGYSKQVIKIMKSISPEEVE